MRTTQAFLLHRDPDFAASLYANRLHRRLSDLALAAPGAEWRAALRRVYAAAAPLGVLVLRRLPGPEAAALAELAEELAEGLRAEVGDE